MTVEYWLVTLEYCVVNTVFKYWNGIAPGYIHEMYMCNYIFMTDGKSIQYDTICYVSKFGNKNKVNAAASIGFY